MPTSVKSLQLFGKMSLALFSWLRNLYIFKLILISLKYFVFLSADAESHWIFLKYQIVREYNRKPPIPPPFNILIIPFLFPLYWYYRRELVWEYQNVKCSMFYCYNFIYLFFAFVCACYTLP